MIAVITVTQNTLGLLSLSSALRRRCHEDGKDLADALGGIGVDDEPQRPTDIAIPRLV
ncbi:hypothetical protein RUR49_24880 [Pseudoxanthobacter sp. M-2]|uniref:hypothetical protein n=1 Tax=Pseudoxanthobacter sp. M-2 TaxID=3078754 RepID=UPI0038FC4005